MAHTEEKGSKIAKTGFSTEHWVAETFNKWKESPLAQDWLGAMDLILVR